MEHLESCETCSGEFPAEELTVCNNKVMCPECKEELGDFHGDEQVDPMGEGVSFDKFMDSIVIKESAVRTVDEKPGQESGARKHAKLYREKAANRIKYGVVK